jgi:glutamate synthase domain-containing protein 3
VSKWQEIEVALLQERMNFELRSFLQGVSIEGKMFRINAEGVHYRDLNNLLRELGCRGAKKLEIYGVCGQRYIGTNLDSTIQINIHGTPGNDLGAFMNGPMISVHGNVQDACGNTMNEGIIVVHGCAGDLTGHSMRGGKIFVRDGVGYRVGVHMKEYQSKKPTLVIGGDAQDFFAEYMAGGIALVLGLCAEANMECRARFVGTGMHGGVIYTRGEVFKVNKSLKVARAGKRDLHVIESLVREFCLYFGNDFSDIMHEQFYKITPVSKRPYGKLYT